MDLDRLSLVHYVRPPKGEEGSDDDETENGPKTVDLRDVYQIIKSLLSPLINLR